MRTPILLCTFGGAHQPILRAIEAHVCLLSDQLLPNKSGEGYSVSCPGLPGCWSQGSTESEALENIRDAIREYLAAVDDLSRGTPDAEVREVDVTVERCRSRLGSVISGPSVRWKDRVFVLSCKEGIP